MENMTHDEMRMCRREIINRLIQESYLYGDGYADLWCIKFLTRNEERHEYGKELKAYG